MIYADKLISERSVQDMIDQYRGFVRHSQLESFTLSELIIVDKAERMGQCEAGVYILYRGDRTLIYVGMSLTSMGRRIAKHRSKIEQASDYWKTRKPVLARLIFVDEPWQAPSLEEFLVQKALSFA